MLILPLSIVAPPERHDFSIGDRFVVPTRFQFSCLPVLLSKTNTVLRKSVSQVSKTLHRHSCFHVFALSWKSVEVGRSLGDGMLDRTSENPYLKVSPVATVLQPDDKTASPNRHAIKETARKGVMWFPFCLAVSGWWRLTAGDSEGSLALALSDGRNAAAVVRAWSMASATKCRAATTRAALPGARRPQRLGGRVRVADLHRDEGERHARADYAAACSSGASRRVGRSISASSAASESRSARL